MATEWGPHMRAVVALAARYGVEVIPRSEEAEGGYPERKRSIGPTDFADLYWPGGPVVVGTRAARATDEALASYALHELGHVVIGGDPERHDEIEGPGLALDFAHFQAAAPQLWDEFMADFAVPSEDPRHPYDIPWAKLSADVRESYLENSRVVAIRAGLLTPSGDLTFCLGGTP